MLQHLNTSLGRLRIVAIIEGITYLLFAITVPLKRVYGIPEPNYVVGLAHGVFFIVYVYLCIVNAIYFRWSKKTTLLALGASLLPGATFIADAKLFKQQEEQGTDR